MMEKKGPFQEIEIQQPKMADRENPKCPYCGKEMNLGYDGKGMAFGRCYFYCDCGAQAPSACVEYATPDDWICIEGTAYLKATARPVQTPLAVDELPGRLKGIVYVETKFNGLKPLPMFIRDIEREFLILWEFGRNGQIHCGLKEYGQTYRFWGVLPTEEERRAAEWME